MNKRTKKALKQFASELRMAGFEAGRAKPFMFFFDPDKLDMSGKGLTRGIYEGYQDSADQVLGAMIEALGQDIPEFHDEDKGISLYIGSTSNMGYPDFLVDYINGAEGVDDAVDKINDWLDANVSLEEDSNTVEARHQYGYMED